LGLRERLGSGLLHVQYHDHNLNRPATMHVLLGCPTEFLKFEVTGLDRQFIRSQRCLLQKDRG
uniref:FERM domain-containing protein n=1 Tax=Haemonchus placei TaxID=6290 RepID=A0A0N4WNC5_HAEPC